MNKRFHPKLITLIASLAFLMSCIDDDPGEAIGDDTEQTSSTSADLSQLYEIRSYMNNKCLDVLAFNNDNGAEAGMWDCWGGSNQRWYWNGGELRSFMNNKCLDVLAFNNDNGAHVGLWDCWGGANQQWYPEGSQIRSRFNYKCLDLLAFNNDNGARVGLWDCWGGANQQWYLRPV